MPETVVALLQLQWTFPAVHELFPTICNEDTCDLGCPDEKEDAFRLCTYFMPNSLNGSIKKDESMRVWLIASAHNFDSPKPLVLEISWDGKWNDIMDEMERSLVVRTVDV